MRRRDLCIAIVISMLLQLVLLAGVLRWTPVSAPKTAVAEQAVAQAVGEPIQVNVDAVLHVVYATGEATAPPTGTTLPTATRTATPTATPTPFIDEPLATNTFCNFYGVTSRLDGAPLPAGSVVRAYDPTGRLVGKFTVHTAGQYGVLPVYGDDPVTTLRDGALVGDMIGFTVNGLPAVVIGPDASIWTMHGDLRRVELVAGGVLATPTTTSPPTATSTPLVTATPVVLLTETPVATTTPAGPWKPAYWDPRLDELGVTVEHRSGRYELIAAWVTINGNWDDVPGWAKQWQLDVLGGDHHTFGRAETPGGNWVSEKFLLVWPHPNYAYGDTRYPEPEGWANLPLGGQNWNPANGPGPYTWFVDGGDKLIGVGMPHNHHWSFFAVWRLR